jgi:hypothetical protein
VGAESSCLAHWGPHLAARAQTRRWSKGERFGNKPPIPLQMARTLLRRRLDLHEPVHDDTQANATERESVEGLERTFCATGHICRICRSNRGGRQEGVTPRLSRLLLRGFAGDRTCDSWQPAARAYGCCTHARIQAHARLGLVGRVRAVEAAAAWCMGAPRGRALSTRGS